MGDELVNLNVWLVHDWLTGMRGGEKILLELVRMFPRARIATLVHVPGASHSELDKRVERVSFLQRLPGGAKQFRNYLPLFPRAIRSLKLDGPCDLVISVSHAVAKSVWPPMGAPHICYCNTPMRYLWGMEELYFGKASPKRMAMAMVAPSLRRFDRQTGNVTEFLANSENVGARIMRCYGRESTVVYAGVDQDFFVPSSGTPREDFYLCAGALVGYKRTDLVVKACLETGRRLVVIGKGPEERRLKALAGGASNIELLGYQSDEVLREHYRKCKGFVFAGEEDFGLTPVEAQACGAPVIAYAAGGAMETVVDGLGGTGVFFGEQKVETLVRAMEKLEDMGEFDAERLKGNALRFTWAGFREGVTAAVARVRGYSGTQVGTHAVAHSG